MKVIAINRYYAPDHSATAQLLADLAEHLAREGVEVVVVTSRQGYGDPQAGLPTAEDRDGVRVRRVRATGFGRTWLPGRALDCLTFHLAACIALLRLARPGDVMLAKTDPPLISVAVLLAARARGVRLVNWCQDLFPEVAAALGMRWAAGPVGNALRAARNRSLQAAEMNVALCDAMAEHLVAQGVARERIAVIHNWADGDLIHPIPHARNPLRAEWGLTGRRVIGYSGNLGRAHDLAAVQDFIAAMAAAEPDLVFLFIGGGTGFAELATWARQRPALNLLFRPYQPRAGLAASLSVPDAHLVSLDPACEGLIMPSKLYGVLAAGRPAIALAAPGGSLARLVQELRIGLVWTAGQEAEVAALLERSRDPALAARIRRTSERAFDRRQALQRWQSVLAPGSASAAETETRLERAA